MTRQTVPAVEGVRLVKRYGDLVVLDGVDLEVRAGEFFGIVGPNGAGKTTLIEILEGLRSADEGEVRILGRPPHPRDPELLRRIAVHSQAPAFFPAHTAIEHITAVAALYGLGRARAVEALERVGLSAKATARVEALSGGQRQRLALAGALVHRPELVFLDEPTAALDTIARATLLELLQELKRDGTSAVYTTHQMSEAQALCDRVAILVNGRIAALDTPQRLISALDAPTRISVPVERLSPTLARDFDGVDLVTVEGGCTVISTRSPGKVLAQVADAAGLDDVETRKGTLEDVYLHLTASDNV